MTKRYFERGGRGVYKCYVCGRGTRRSTQEGDSELCSDCWDLAGSDNTHNDEGREPTAEELRFYELAVADIVKKGGDAAKVRSAFPYIWVNKGKAGT
jgi:hypothetical protein